MSDTSVSCQPGGGLVEAVPWYPEKPPIPGVYKIGPDRDTRRGHYVSVRVYEDDERIHDEPEVHVNVYLGQWRW